jgi:hypothetical protein
MTLQPVRAFASRVWNGLRAVSSGTSYSFSVTPSRYRSKRYVERPSASLTTSDTVSKCSSMRPEYWSDYQTPPNRPQGLRATCLAPVES